MSRVGKLPIGLYIGKSGVAAPYGTAGSIVLILLGVYYSSQIVLFGAELAAKAFAERHGSRRLVAVVKRYEGADIPRRSRV